MPQTFLLVLAVAYATATGADIEASGSGSINGDNLIVCDYDRDFSPIISLLKEKYPEYLNMFPCRYLNPSRKISSGSDESKDNGSSTGNKLSKDGGGKRSVLLDVPINRGERYFTDRISMFATRNPIVEGYKRGPGFRSWGGKRTLYQDEAGDLDKRTRFSSWGGKRSDQDGIPDKWLRLCDGKETCDETYRKDMEIYNPYEHIYPKYPLWAYRNLFGSKKYQS